MKQLDYPDRHFLNSAAGWLDLGCPREAAAEVDRISVFGRFHPEAMVVRWRIHAHEGQWQRAGDLARIFTKVAPSQASGWICLAYSLFRLKRPLEAWLQLMPQTRVFPKVSAIPYMLACFASQMGHAKEAERWFAKSGELGGPTRILDGDLDSEALALLSPRPCASPALSKSNPASRSGALWPV
jgi:hypothetical protein